MAELALSGVTKRFGDLMAVDGLDLTVGDGEFVVLLGPTGAGKTTTLRLIAGLERADTGRIRIGGVDVGALAPAARDVAFVFQQYSLYPHLTVYDNLAFPLRSPTRRVPEGEIRQRVEAVVELLRIAPKLGNKATRLSGGEMQRVAIGRALVRDPQAFLMDEPLSSLDAKLRADLRLELKHIQRDLGATVLYVTHDQIEAMTMASRIGVIDRGRLVQIGTPREIYGDPVSAHVATRLGQPGINLIPHDLMPCPGLPAAARLIGARTEHLRVHRGPPNGHARARVDWIEHLGDQIYLHLLIGERRLVSLVEADTALRPGDEVGLELAAPLFFDADGNRIRTA